MTEESCMVCHASGRIAALDTNHVLPFASGYQDNVTVNITSVTSASGRVQVAFHAANSTGPLTLASSDLRFLVAGLVPFVPQSPPVSGSSYFDWWATERSTTVFGTLAPGGTAGDYTYTSAANVLAAPNPDPTLFVAGNGPPTGTTVQRVFLRVSKTGHNTGNATYDFSDKATMASVANPRDIVPSAACNKCHFERIADHGHGGGYNKSEVCVMCHSPLLSTTPMVADGFDWPTMIHQIHGAITVINDGTIPAGGTSAKPNWGEVTYPAQLNDCKVCHTGGAQSDNYKNNPTALGCTSCHTFVQFTDSAAYNASNAACGSAGWVYPNPCNHVPAKASTAACSSCHDAADIDGFHDATLNKVRPAAGQTMNNAPEFIANLTITPPAAGSFYAVNETPTVTVTLKYRNADGSPGADVPAAFYTGAKHAAGTTGNTLSAANLYVYGPRTAPVPVLTPGAAVKPVATQRTSLLLPSTDINNLTDATGFKYQLQPIPAGMTGTFFVRFYGTNYGYVSDTNYGTDSNAFLTIQVGTATAEKKISGSSCVDCHGTGTAPFHDARHGVKFDTDECISCHDQSGNHADPLSNRVHAVHAASVKGDMLAIPWAEVKYPVGAKSGFSATSGGIGNCGVCHDSTNKQYTKNVSETACTGCHADSVGALDHFWQNGGAVYTPAVLP
jgi:hypothetical protein